MGTTGKLMEYFAKTGEFSGVRTEVRGSGTVCLEGCDGIIDYSHEVIAVRAGRMRIDVIGSDLRIGFFSAEGILIEGRVSSVNYSYRR